MHGLEQQWAEQVDFVYLDIDDPRTDSFKRQLGYRYQPHLFLLDAQGAVVQQWVGFVDGATLEQALADIAP